MNTTLPFQIVGQFLLINWNVRIPVEFNRDNFIHEILCTFRKSYDLKADVIKLIL